MNVLHCFVGWWRETALAEWELVADGPTKFECLQRLRAVKGIAGQSVILTSGVHPVNATRDQLRSPFDN